VNATLTNARGSALAADSAQVADPLTAGPASVEITVAYGFWIFLLSDIVMFSAVFAAYAVLSSRTAGGPSGHSLFDLRNVAIETGCLLLSSFTCGVASIGARAHNGLMYYGGMAATWAIIVNSQRRPRVTCNPWQPTRVKNALRKALRPGPAPLAMRPANS